MKKEFNQEYALYHGDEFVAIGTKKELAELEGVSMNTISFYATPCHLKRTNYRGKVVIKVWMKIKKKRR